MSAAAGVRTGSGWNLDDPRHRTYGLKTAEDHIKLYDEWAASYDEDV